MKKQAIPLAVRRAVALRQGAIPGRTVPIKCHYCPRVGSAFWPNKSDGNPGFWVAFQRLELDHVIPESKGGKTTAKNIVLACQPCNRSKGTKILHGGR